MLGWNDEIAVQANAAHCYRVATDLDRCQRWMPRIEGIERIDDGELRVGSRWRETRREGKRVHTMEITVFESHGPAQGDPPYVHCAGANMDSMKSYYRFVFDDADNGRSTVRLEARVEPKNWWSALLARVMVHLMRRSERDLLQRLKAYCEQG